MFGKSKLSALSLCAVLAISVFSGCNIQSNSTTQPTDSAATTAQATTIAQTEDTDDNINIQTESTTPNTKLFEDVYAEYSEALVARTPVLISEFNSESEYSTEGNNAESLLEEKKEKLADIFSEGLAQFVIIVGDTDASDDEYEYWHIKLEEVYNDQVDELVSSCATQSDIEYGEDMDY